MMNDFTLRYKKLIFAAASFTAVLTILMLLFSACSGAKPASTPTNSAAGGMDNNTAAILLEYLGQTQTAIGHVLTATVNAPGKPVLPQPTGTPVPGISTAIYQTSPTVTPDFPVYKCGLQKYPAFGVVDVVQDKQVSISTCFFPKNVPFSVHMGTVGAADLDDIQIGAFQSGDGGIFVATYKIPEKLIGSQSITIWMEFNDGFSANNWFYNSNTRETK